MGKRTQGTVKCPAGCRALCCKYIVSKLRAPRTKVDWDELYWFLAHEKVAVYIEQRKWYLMVEVPCRHLTTRSRCRIYGKRPIVCRLHPGDSCEYTGEVEFQEFMTTCKDLVRLMEKRGISFRMPWNRSDMDARCKGRAPVRSAGARGNARGEKLKSKNPKG